MRMIRRGNISHTGVLRDERGHGADWNNADPRHDTNQ